MELVTVNNFLIGAARRHPGRRTVRLETSSSVVTVRLAVKRTMPRNWQPGQNAILEGSHVMFALLSEFCPVIPVTGNVIQDSVDNVRWSIQSVTHAQGGLCYECACTLQQ